MSMRTYVDERKSLVQFAKRSVTHKSTFVRAHYIFYCLNEVLYA